MIRLLSVALACLLLVAIPAPDEPFGLATVPTASGVLKTRWHNLRLHIAADEATIADCRTSPAACPTPAALELIGIVDEAMRYEGRARLGHINRAINLAIAATKQDVPMRAALDALTSPGDCKSFAIAKYVALGEAGIAAADRRVIHVRDHTRPAELHMVVVARLGAQWLILDNETMVLIDSMSKPTYEPLHMLDENGAWDYLGAVPVG